MNVPVDYSKPLTYLRTTCADCGNEVTYANTKIVKTPVVPAPEHRGMATHTERRVCNHH
jgi:ribosomal protein S27AE